MKSDIEISQSAKIEPTQTAVAFFRTFYFGFFLGVCLLVIFIHFVNVGYETNDDSAMRAITSGAHSEMPDEHLVLSNVLLGLGLKALYTTWNEIDWYSFLFYLAHAVSFGAFWKLTFRQGFSWLRGAGFFLLYLIFMPRFWIQLQYTTTAFPMAVAGTFGMLASLQRDVKTDRILLAGGGAMIVGASLLRWEAAGLACVACVPLVLYRAWQMRSGKIVFAFLLTCFVMLALLMGDHFYYQINAEWKQYLRFYKSLYLVQHSLSCKEALLNAPPAILGTHCDALMLRNWFYLDPDFYSPEALQRLIKSDIPKSSLSLLGHYWGYGGVGIYLLGLGFLPTLMIGMMLWRLRTRKTLLLMVMAPYVLILYLLPGAFMSLPPRVTHTLPFLMAIITLFICVDSLDDERKPLSVRVVSYFFWIIVVLAVAGYLYVGAGYLRYIRNQHWNHSEYAGWLQTFEREVRKAGNRIGAEDPIVISFPRYPTVWASPFVSQAPLRLDRTICAGWLLHSPILRAQQERLGLNRNLFLDLLRPDVLVLGTREEMEPVREFLFQHYGQNVSIEEILQFRNVGFSREYLRTSGLYRFTPVRGSE